MTSTIASSIATTSVSSAQVAVLLLDPVGVRNFLVGPLFSLLSRPPVVFHQFLQEEIETIPAPLRASSSQWQNADFGMGGVLRQTLRQTLGYAHMYCVNTRSMQFNRDRPLNGSWRSRALRKSTKTLGRWMRARPRVRALESAYFETTRRSTEYDRFRRQFQEQRPGVVFSSTQKAPEALAAVLAARDLGIPTAAFVVSWDNLTSKARIGAPFDHYLVWGPQMKKELLEIYPEVPPHRIHVTGSPQFDSYGDSVLHCSREEFFAEIGADARRPLICYSGGDIETCPEDQDHLRILAELVRGGAITGDPQILLRPSPADDLERYKETLERYPEILPSMPLWSAHRVGERVRRIPMLEDSWVLANLTRHADVNVNLASTMTLDFAVNDTPVVNVAFDVASPNGSRPPLWSHYYEWEHYRPVVDLGAARFARSPSELAEHVQAYLNDPALDRENRRRLVDLQLGIPVGQASHNVAALLEAIAK